MLHNFETQLEEIRQMLLAMSETTERSLSLAMKALTERNSELADQAELMDSEIDQKEIEMDEAIITYMATHAPIATDCRLMLIASKLSSALENIGDQATTIARRARDLNKEPQLKPLIDIPAMAEIAFAMLRDGIEAFVEKDSALAKDVIPRDQEVDKIHRQLSRELTSYMIENPATITRCLNLMTVAKSLERIADYAQNIAEEVYYLHCGRDIRHASHSEQAKK